MGIFPFSALALLAASQAGPPPEAVGDTADDSVATVTAPVGPARDSAGGGAWLALAQLYLHRSADFHHHAAPLTGDTLWLRASLDSAEQAFGRAAALLQGTPAGDSAATLRIAAWGERGLLAWELSGLEAAGGVWMGLPADVRLAPLLEEFGENLLRACPRGGVLVTAGPVDTYAAWYMHFAQGLRRDLAIVPLAVWGEDSVYRRRVLAERSTAEPGRRDGGGYAELRALADHHPICVSMMLERPPRLRRGIKWTTRPLLWVGGARAGEDHVPARDFVFTSLRLAADARETWLEPVLEAYRRAARLNRGLCESFAVFRLREEVGCR